MTAILFDGFDHTDTVDVWTQGAAVGSITTSVVRTGTRAWRFGVGTVLYRALTGGQEDDVVILGAAFYADDANGAFDNGPELVVMEDTVDHIRAKGRNGTRSFRLFRGTTLLAETEPNMWFQDSWNYFELKVKIHDSAGTAEFRINGVTILTFAGDTRNGGTSGICNRLEIRGGTDGTGQEVFADDVYLLNEQGSVNNDFLGDTRCYPLYPNGNGNYSQLTGSDGNSVDNYLLVDEVGTPVITDYVESATVGNKDTYTFENLPVTLGTIRGVEVRMHAAKSDTGTKRLRSVTRRTSTDAFGADKVLAAIPTYQTHIEMQELDPHAGPGAWTIDNVNGTEWGAEVRA